MYRVRHVLNIFVRNLRISKTNLFNRFSLLQSQNFHHSFSPVLLLFQRFFRYWVNWYFDSILWWASSFIGLPDNFAATRVSFFHNWSLLRQYNNFWSGEKYIRFFMTRDMNSGNHGYAGQKGTTRIPSAVSFIIFRRIFGIIANGGKA